MRKFGYRPGKGGGGGGGGGGGKHSSEKVGDVQRIFFPCSGKKLEFLDRTSQTGLKKYERLLLLMISASAP